MPVTVRSRTARKTGSEEAPGTTGTGAPKPYKGKARSPWSRAGAALSGGVTEQLESRYIREPGQAGYSGNTGYSGESRWGAGLSPQVTAGNPGKTSSQELSATYGDILSPAAPAWSPSSGAMATDNFPQLNPIGQDTAKTATERLLGEAPGTNALHSAQQGLSQPSAASQYWQGVKGQFNYDPGKNRASEAYDDLRSSRPDFQNDPGLSQFYDLAEKRAKNKLESDFAQRGAYGSSVMTGQIASSVAGLEAEKANREADYRLRNIGEQRAWGTAAGELGRAGDVTDLGHDQQGLSTLMGGAQVSQGADNAEQGRLGLSGQLGLAEGAADTQRLSAAAGVALPAESLSNTERQGAFDNLTGVAGALSNTVGSFVNSLTESDRSLLQDVVQGTLSADQAMQIFAQNHTQEEMDQFAGIVGSVGSIVGMGA